jgi:hypothetical protein
VSDGTRVDGGGRAATRSNRVWHQLSIGGVMFFGQLRVHGTQDGTLLVDERIDPETVVSAGNLMVER